MHGAGTLFGFEFATTGWGDFAVGAGVMCFLSRRSHLQEKIAGGLFDFRVEPWMQCRASQPEPDKARRVPAMHDWTLHSGLEAPYADLRFGREAQLGR
jgi:hypothetical protein